MLLKGKISNKHLRSAGWLSSKSACCFFVVGFISLFMRRNFWAAPCGKKHLLLEANPVGSTFNIQNSIPHKSQKPKAVAETNRATEFQRGTVGATESAKEGDSVLPEGSDIGLGPGDRAFEPHYSDQQKQVVLLKTACFCNFLHICPNHYLPSALTANKNLPDHLRRGNPFLMSNARP
nr:hypothetical protein [uncultured Dysosmobacter sp.]